MLTERLHSDAFPRSASPPAKASQLPSLRAGDSFVMLKPITTQPEDSWIQAQVRRTAWTISLLHSVLPPLLFQINNQTN